MVLVTVPVSVVYTPLVTVAALPLILPVNAPTNAVDVTDVNPASVVELAPNANVVEPIVTELLVNLVLAILPLNIVLVTVPVSVV